MGRKAAAGFLIATFVLFAGCKTPCCRDLCKPPMLKELDADMPSAVVKQYAASDKAYVDHGFLWLPGITMLSMHVSKTTAGYHADGHFAMGPLASLRVGGQSSDFGDDGLLLRYTARARTLWGLLLSDYTCREYVESRDNWHEQWSRKFLFGLLGYEGDSDHWRAFYFLCIPIPTCHGHPHKFFHERREGVERQRENGEDHEQEERTPEPQERHHT